MLGEKPSLLDEFGFLPVKKGKAIALYGAALRCEDELRLKLEHGSSLVFALCERHGVNVTFRLQLTSVAPLRARRFRSKFFMS